MIKEMWLAKDEDGKIYGYESHPITSVYRAEVVWYAKGSESPIYPETLLLIFGDKIRMIDLTEQVPVKIQFKAELL
jgi:hypothetical protein